ncbi:MAG: DUF6261 family protein [Bacteroidales bacterium]|jgi:hypothetical protein|nr:DUF6261 family protein [Bacteroidales bacterium]
MEEKIKNPDVQHYNNGDHVRFNRRAHEILDKNKEAIDVSELLTDYELKLALEEHIYKWMRQSEFTEKKAAADYDRDKTLIGITATVKAATKHVIPLMQDYAKHVFVAINNFGNLAKADYNAETAGIDSLLVRLRSKEYIVAVEALGLTPWLDELEKYNNLFKEYANEVEQELVEKPSIKYKDARHDTDKALRKIIKRISSLIDINGPEAYSQFVSEFNVHVNLYNTQLNEHYGRLHAKRDISNAEIDTIPVQTYMGKPVYVIPVVKIRKIEKDNTESIIELEFTKDFTVGYKNNAAAGTATLTIKGIGKYSGEIITTFNIVN